MEFIPWLVLLIWATVIMTTIGIIIWEIGSLLFRLPGALREFRNTLDKKEYDDKQVGTPQDNEPGI